MRLQTTIGGKKYQSRECEPWEIRSWAGGVEIDFKEIVATIDRQQVLRGEWKDVATHARFFTVKDGLVEEFRKYSVLDGWAKVNRIMGKGAEGCYDSRALRMHTALCVFFPTRELAEEYLLIAKGEWLPKTGDVVYGWFRDSNTEDIFYSGRVAGMDYCGSLTSYFPSRKQMDAYAKRDAKVKEMSEQAARICAIGKECKEIVAKAATSGIKVTFDVDISN